jgi:hypothetical protein
MFETFRSHLQSGAGFNPTANARAALGRVSFMQTMRKALLFQIAEIF